MRHIKGLATTGMLSDPLLQRAFVGIELTGLSVEIFMALKVLLKFRLEITRIRSCKIS